MKHIRTTVALASLAIATLQAQTPGPATAQPSTATMDQSIAFINDSYRKQPAFSFNWENGQVDEFQWQNAALESACVLNYEYRVSSVAPNDNETHRTHISSNRLDMAHADPRTIEVTSIAKVKTPVYSVLLTQPSTSDGHDRGFLDKVLLGVFYDRDTADRVAKAVIHAVVLCHPASTSSPF